MDADTPQEIAVQADEEVIARIIDPRSWEVLDGYLADVKRKYRGQNAAYDPDSFRDKASLEKARAILARITSTRTPMDGEVGELIERLRRVKHLRTQWIEPHGEVDVPVDADMADWEGVFAVPVNPDGPEAADTLTAYRDKVERLREALRPFADEAENWDREGPDAWPDDAQLDDCFVTVGDFRRALAALTDPPNLPPGD